MAIVSSGSPAPGGRPRATLFGGAADVAEHLGIACVLVSISHCRSHATAYAMALDDLPSTFEDPDDDDE